MAGDTVDPEPAGAMPNDDQTPEDSPDVGSALPDQQFARELDLRHVTRPLPLVLIARALSKMPPGELLRVVLNSTDGVASDVWALLRARASFRLVSHQVTEEGHVHVFERSRD